MERRYSLEVANVRTRRLGAARVALAAIVAAAAGLVPATGSQARDQRPSLQVQGEEKSCGTPWGVLESGESFQYFISDDFGIEYTCVDGVLCAQVFDSFGYADDINCRYSPASSVVRAPSRPNVAGTSAGAYY